ncbi:MAG: DNA polymerase IV [Ruminococcaceae bacterium]|nr:DNA polymerase IV [Oscillospiraceae bacterium]
MNRVIIHSDLNNFFASVECLKRPWLGTSPVAVAGDVEKRHGIILAKNALAASFGVKTGEPIWSAREKCPALITVPPHYDDYIAISRMARSIYLEYSDKVEPFGIDECWLDVSDIASSYDEGIFIANDIRNRIKSSLGVTVSCGVSFNKVFAKLGSDIKKPDATTLISPSNFKQTVWPLPADSLLFVGRATKKALARLNVKTIGELANTDAKALEMVFGKNGICLWNYANGLDTSPVISANIDIPIKSVGNSITTCRDIINDEEIKVVFYELCETVSARLRKLNFVCSTVQIYVRDRELNSYERQTKMPLPCRTVQALFKEAFGLYRANHISGKPVRSLGVRATNLTDDNCFQMCISPSAYNAEKQEHLDSTADYIREHFGKGSLKRGIMLYESILSGIDVQEEKCSFSKI